MAVVEKWNGGAADALRAAMRMTNEKFAEALGIGVRTVAKWRADPSLIPSPEMQALLDTLLRKADAEAQERFAAVRAPIPQQRAAFDVSAEQRLADDPALSQTLSWLDEHAGWPSGTARHRVAVEAQRIDDLQRRDRSHARTQVGRAAVARALDAFYGQTADFAPYRAAVAGQTIATSILTRPEWLDLALVLGQGHDHTALTGLRSPVHFAEDGAEAAIRRIAHTAVTGGRMVNAALY